MPPMYEYICKKCESRATVLRSFSEYANPPTGDELPEKECEHEWERELGASTVIRGPSFGAKGYWFRWEPPT